MNKIAIYLTVQEAELFKIFREHQAVFELMQSKRGKVIMSFNNGVVTDVDIEMKEYKRKKVIPLC